MQAERLKSLEAFIEQDPNDPFNYYALALEYMKTDQDKALELFNYLLVNHENYLATYYQLGNLLEDIDEEERALDIYLAGIEIAEIQGNEKAIEELTKAHKNLEDQQLL